MTDTNDLDPSETREWLESVEDVIDRDGTDRAHFLLDQAVAAARSRGANLPFGSTTAYVNTIPPDQQPPYPGDLELEWRIRTINRWNAMATVVRRNKVSSEYGGHIASFASSAVLYDIGLNHFWRTRTARTAATSCSSRATPSPVSTRAPSWKGDFRPRRSTTSAPRPAARACRPTRTRG